ncbi:MAG: TadE family protein [Oscillochloridaceae bacterium umkhey_bin13]
MRLRICNRPRRRGQALTELALFLPMIALLLIGLIEFGFLLYAHVQVSSAAREAARAASLYRDTRYSTVSLANLNQIPRCATGIDGWTLQQTIDQAIVRFPPSGNGCPTTTGTPLYSALGRLDATRSTQTALCPTGNVTGWNVGITTTPTFTHSNATIMPAAGSSATVTLCYPHRLLIMSDLLPFLGDPVWINKSVNLQFQP